MARITVYIDDGDDPAGATVVIRCNALEPRFDIPIPVGMLERLKGGHFQRLEIAPDAQRDLVCVGVPHEPTPTREG